MAHLNQSGPNEEGTYAVVDQNNQVIQYFRQYTTAINSLKELRWMCVGSELRVVKLK